MPQHRNHAPRWLTVLLSWVVAIAFDVAVLVATFLLVATWVASTIQPDPVRDLSDIAPGLVAAFLGGIAGLLAGALGASMALVPIRWWLERTGAMGAQRYEDRIAVTIRRRRSPQSWTRTRTRRMCRHRRPMHRVRGR
jgi:hypothetical protein